MPDKPEVETPEVEPQPAGEKKRIDPKIPQELGGFSLGQRSNREHTRSKMAILFVLGFFAIQFLCFAYCVKKGASVNDLKEILVAVIGALSGTLGFIIGYYFKSSQE